MKKLTLNLDKQELQLLKELTNHLIDEEKVNTITDIEMSQAIKALMLIFYMNEIVPVKYGKGAVVTFKEN